MFSSPSSHGYFHDLVHIVRVYVTPDHLARHEVQAGSAIYPSRLEKKDYQKTGFNPDQFFGSLSALSLRAFKEFSCVLGKMVSELGALNNPSGALEPQYCKC